MPPKKKDPTLATPPAPPPLRRSTRASVKATDDKTATTTTLKATAPPTTKKTSAKNKSSKLESDMGAVLSSSKSKKAKKASATGSVRGEADVSSKIEDLTVEDDTKAKGKRKSTNTNVAEKPDKKPRVSRSVEPEEQVKEVASSSSKKPAKAAPKKSTTPRTVEEWYQTYASEEDPEQIDIPGISQLLEDLNVKFDGASIYVLCWKLECETMGIIPKKKWLAGMNKHNIKNNTQLLKQLSTWLQETKPTSPPSDSFQEFYKFMFGFSKATPETKSVAVDSAIAVLTFLLDPVAYDLKYDPETATPLPADKHPYPHITPFVKFLTEKQPVKVINRDQWLSFIPFNTALNYNLDNYNPDGAWPGLFDQYVDFRRETEGLTIGPKDGPDTET